MKSLQTSCLSFCLFCGLLAFFVASGSVPVFLLTRVFDGIDVPIDDLLNVNTTSPEEAIGAARIVIKELIRENQRISPQFVRLGFHDCVGGCDGCLDMEDPENRGLDFPIQELSPVIDAYAKHGVSRADIWALAALVGADVSQPKRERVDFVYEYYGRRTCDQLNKDCFDAHGMEVPCTATRGPYRKMPSPDLTTHGVLQYFDKMFGLTMQETVALMGAHTLGQLHRSNSGFDGDKGRVDHQETLDNQYYHTLVGESDSMDGMVNNAPTWQQSYVDNSDLPSIKSRWQWNRLHERPDNDDPDSSSDEPIDNNNDSDNGNEDDGHDDNGNDKDDEDNRDDKDKRDDEEKRDGEDYGDEGSTEVHTEMARGSKNRQGLRGQSEPKVERSGEVMVNADIALVRDMEGFLSPYGKASCAFKPNTDNRSQRRRMCPVAHTLPQVATYRSDNVEWLRDFRKVFTRVLLHGYDVQYCRSSLCPLELSKERSNIFGWN